MLQLGDALTLYPTWQPPRVILSDGPYGINGYPGDLKTPQDLPAWYQPHAKAWFHHSPAGATLWFWNTEIGWAHTHSTLAQEGWVYRGLNVWDKGLAHIAGNCNTRTMQKFPVVTEVCAHYIKRTVTAKWMRSEWIRSGLPLYRANEAAGVRNAASRKYLTLDRNWYPPPTEVMARIVAFLNEKGNPAGRPYYPLHGKPWDAEVWERERPVFHLDAGLTNVWQTPALRAAERIKLGTKARHPNQKPLALVRRLIRAASNPGEIVWDPFSGLGTTALAAELEGREFFGSEINPLYFQAAQTRLTPV